MAGCRTDAKIGDEGPRSCELARILLPCEDAMSLPRQILPGRFYMITRRCAFRMFLLRPDDVTNHILLYCLLEAAARFNIDVITSTMMSNHHHTIVHDPDGNVVEFMEHFHKFSAKALNVHRGREENVWAAEPPGLLQLLDREAVIDKIVYAATNPVKDGLVERVHHWPGVNLLPRLLDGAPVVVTRPQQFFSATGCMPETVERSMSVPAVLGDRAAFLEEVRTRVDAAERTFAAQRQAAGRRVLGRKGVKAQSWRGAPRTEETPRGTIPRVASRNRWLRIEAAQRDRAFLDAYFVARDGWLEGRPVTFPAGTYWLRRFAAVPIAAA